MTQSEALIIHAIIAKVNYIVLLWTAGFSVLTILKKWKVVPLQKLEIS